MTVETEFRESNSSCKQYSERAEILEDTALLIAAGGAGNRFGKGRNKLLAEVGGGEPVIARTVLNLQPLIAPELIVIMAPAALQEDFRTTLISSGLSSAIQVGTGGRTRCESVYRGLQMLPETVEIVAVQDGARPFTSKELLRKCVERTRKTGSGIAARRVTDTIKKARNDGMVLETPDRTTLWAAETPQVFRLEKLRAAYERAIREGWQTTDDAQVLEKAGGEVYLVEHNENNRKITYPEDLIL